MYCCVCVECQPFICLCQDPADHVSDVESSQSETLVSGTGQSSRSDIDQWMQTVLAAAAPHPKTRPDTQPAKAGPKQPAVAPPPHLLQPHKRQHAEKSAAWEAFNGSLMFQMLLCLNSCGFLFNDNCDLVIIYNMKCILLLLV